MTGGLRRVPDRIYASPMLAGGKIYLVSRTRGTYAIEASPAAAGGQLLRSDSALYCIGKKRCANALGKASVAAQARRACLTRLEKGVKGDGRGAMGDRPCDSGGRVREYED